MAITLSQADSLYYPPPGGPTSRYTYQSSYPAGTRLLFTMATGSQVWSFFFPGGGFNDSKGNHYTVLNRSNDGGSAAIVHSKLTTAVGAGDYLEFFGPPLSLEGWVQLWAAGNDTSVTTVAGGIASVGLPSSDKITTPVSLTQSSGLLANGGAVLGVMQFLSLNPGVSLSHGGSPEAENHAWTPAGYTGSAAESVWSDSVPAGVNTTFVQSGTYGAKIYSWAAVQVILEAAPPPAVRGIRHTRTNTGRIILADSAGGGQVWSRRYDDALPPALAGSVLLDSGSTDQASITTRPSQWVDEVYGIGGAVRLKTSKDRGRTYGSAVTVAASGYRNPTHAYDRQRQRFVVAMQSTSDSHWYVTVAGMDAAGAIGTWSTPVLLANGSGNFAAQLTHDPDGAFTFSYINNAAVTAIIRCRNLSNTGAGTWS